MKKGVASASLEATGRLFREDRVVAPGVAAAAGGQRLDPFQPLVDVVDDQDNAVARRRTLPGASDALLLGRHDLGRDARGVKPLLQQAGKLASRSAAPVREIVEDVVIGEAPACLKRGQQVVVAAVA